MPDKYQATWVSHSSITDFLKCPRAYYLRNVYKDPKTGHKITVVKPPLALGAAVHEVLESLATLPVEERFRVSLLKRLDTVWLKVTGKKGGFKSYSEEIEYRDRAKHMLTKLEKNPGPLLNKAIKIKSTINLPNYYLSEKENIILCGKIDWLEYNDKNDSVRIIDFKTGKNEEQDNSLQLPIYVLLAKNTQSKNVNGISYWYLDKEGGEAIIDKQLPDIKKSEEEILEIAMKIKESRQKKYFDCMNGGCFHCRNLERVFSGEGEKVGVSETKQDIYFLPD